jgi:aspartyl-tRNA(Asn)/glutamyl-tRNA(Gln) amidotransferase subunit C
MPLNKNLISRLEALARITLPPESKDKIASQLKTIICYIDQLAELDTTGIRPADGIRDGGRGSLRADLAVKNVTGRDILAQAPDAEGDFFRVPRVLDREEGR